MTSFSLPAQAIRYPDHPETDDPSHMRQYAVDLVLLADDAEGHQGPHGFVTRIDLLMRMRTIEEQMARLKAEW